MNNEDLLFYKKIQNIKDSVFKNGQIHLLKFLDSTKQEIVKSIVNKDVYIYFFGGYLNSDYKRCIISNFEMESLDFKINCYKIIYNKKYLTLNHRNILGTIMSLGISRDVLGDILNFDNEYYIFIANEICPYILENFKTINNHSISLEIINDINFNKIDEYEKKLYFLASLRLDVVISSLCNLSRNKSFEMITLDNVKVNHILIKNPSHILKENDILSIKGYGRMKVLSILNPTKSGKIKVELGKLI